MTEAELLEEFKNRENITGTYQDKRILGFIRDTMDFIKSAGGNVEDEASVGAICRGVSDLWNNGDGKGDYSQFFYKRVYQLCLEGVADE